jgi:hypothetical protein
MYGVVAYGRLMVMNLSDLMQRIGQATCAFCRVGDTLIFLPYCIFSNYGGDKPGQTLLPVREGKERRCNKPIRDTTPRQVSCNGTFITSCSVPIIEMSVCIAGWLRRPLLMNSLLRVTLLEYEKI